MAKDKIIIEIESDKRNVWFSAIDDNGKDIVTFSAAKADKLVAKFRARGFNARARCPAWEGK